MSTRKKPAHASPELNAALQTLLAGTSSTRVTADMVELDADEVYLLEATLAIPRTQVGNNYVWSQERRTPFEEVFLRLTRTGLIRFHRERCHMVLTGFGYRCLKANHARLEKQRLGTPVMLPVPRHLVADVAAALSMGCWVWEEARERPILALRETLLQLEAAP